MRRRIAQLLLLSVFVIVATSGVAGTLPTAVTVNDPAGDAGNFEGGMDITSVDLQTDGKDFYLTVTCKQDLANVLKTTGRAGYPVEVYLDTDNNPETGGESTFVDTKKGFEIQILASACIKSGYSSVCGGNVKPEKVEATFAGLQVTKLRKDRSRGEEVIDATSYDEGKTPATLAGQTIKAVIPYEKLGLKSGMTIRVAIREAHGGMGEESFMADVVLSVK